MNKCKPKQKNKGFSLAELMAVIAIIAILAGLGFIAISHYWRILKQMEFDSIAKEIFISAQNHISMVDNESYLGSKSFGTPENSTDTEGVYYYVVGSDKSILNGDNSLSLMLPFASIDETVRQGGSYIIRYHKQSARILDVFYSTPSSKYGHVFTEAEYPTLMSGYRGDENKKKRREYTEKSVIGYYGGEEANTLNYIDDLPERKLIIENAERLKVKITNAEAIEEKYPDDKLRIVVTGLKSGKSRYIDLVLNDETEYILDSITESGMHFYDLFCNGDSSTEHPEIKGTDNLIPGENISVQAKVFVDNSLCKLAFSDKKGTNSIFGDNTTNTKAEINNIRHLENLDPEVSKFAVNTITSAEQSADLAWDSFLTKIGGENVYVYKPGEKDEKMTSSGKYYPVQMPSLINLYDGKNHKISKIDASSSGNVGLFSTANGKTIKDLELLDFRIYATGDNGYAGALAGRVSETMIENVAVHDSTGSSYISASTVAGGLVGEASSSSKINTSLAAVVVNGGSYAGGLIGISDNSVVDSCYAAGHTENGKYRQDKIDVVSTGGYAGGLIGQSKSSTVKNSYATTSVNGGAGAGGFAGTASGKKSDESYSFINCYSVGYVKTTGDTITNKGGFIGLDQSCTYSNCTYLAIANNSKLNAVGNKTEVSGIIAADVASASHGAAYSYIHFLSGNTSKNDALPYDSTLPKSYHYRNIEELTLMTASGYVKTHYGDWPLYETLVVNE